MRRDLAVVASDKDLDPDEVGDQVHEVHRGERDGTENETQVETHDQRVVGKGTEGRVGRGRYGGDAGDNMRDPEVSPGPDLQGIVGVVVTASHGPKIAANAPSIDGDRTPARASLTPASLHDVLQTPT